MLAATGCSLLRRAKLARVQLAGCCPLCRFPPRFQRPTGWLVFFVLRAPWPLIISTPRRRVIWPAPINKTFAACHRRPFRRHVSLVCTHYPFTRVFNLSLPKYGITSTPAPRDRFAIKSPRTARSTLNDANRLHGHGEFLAPAELQTRSLRVIRATLQIAANTLEEFWEQLIVRWGRFVN